MSRADLIAALSTSAEPPKHAPLPVRQLAAPQATAAPSNGPEDRLAPLPLGFNKGTFYYLSRVSMQVHEIPAAAHAQNTLISMAPLSYWMMRYPNKGSVDWASATDALMSGCHAMGIYNPDRLRGRGVAFDNGRTILHLGESLIVDGIPQNHLSVPNSRYVYEKAERVDLQLGIPLTDEEAYRIIEVANMFSWASQDMGLLFAGWLVTAPVCGGLPWRTHMWLTGQMGSGKSWVMSNFVRPMIGEMGFYVQSKTTEAGIRQNLRIDARPVVFDESESHNDQDRNRLQQVLDIARQASSEDGFQILKGTAHGKEMRFKIQSSFLFSSINFGAIQSADESRIIPVSLVPMTASVDTTARFETIKKMIAELLTPEFNGRLLARTLALLPTIRSNIAVFSRALSEVLPSRQADTIGSVVAGVYSLCSSKTLTYDEAKQFIANKKWITSVSSRTETDADHTKAITHFLEQLMRHTPSHEYSVGEALNIIYSQPENELSKTLARHGIRMKESEVYIARAHHIIDGFFEHTPWAKVWDKTFLQFPGMEACDKTIDFAGTKKRAIKCQLSTLLG